MRMTFLTASVSRNAGGLFESVRSLAMQVANDGHGVTVFGVRDENTRRDLSAWAPLDVRTFPVFGPSRLSFSPGLTKILTLSCDDILHSHSLWNHTSIAANAWHKRTGKPYIVHPHGMLDPWAVRNSYLAKILIKRIFEQRHLDNAACIRALNLSEASAVRQFKLRNPICVIPNGITLPQLVNCESPLDSIKKSGYKILLYLGRLHPKKGLITLLRAWNAIRARQSGGCSGWVLALAGWDENGHEAELKSLTRDLEIPCLNLRETGDDKALENGGSAPVAFLGPQFGEVKTACYNKCDAYILPSLSEGLPMTVLEAWSHGKPVLMTPACNLPEGFAVGASIKLESRNIELGLNRLFEMSSEEREDMGALGLGLVQRQFLWPKIASEICAVSEWIVGGGCPPACVQLA